jgi:hypothetical protein
MKPLRGLPIGDGHMVSELVELAGESCGEAGAFGSIEVIGAEIGVGDTALEHPVDGRQDGGGDGHDRLAWTAAGLEPMEQRPEIAALPPDGDPGNLDEQGLEPGIALAQPGGPALAGAFVIAGTQAGPRDEMAGTRETVHVDTNLGEDHGGRQLMEGRKAHPCGIVR